jgi:hypothetical protein
VARLLAGGLLLGWLLPAALPAGAEGLSATLQEILDGPEIFIDSRQARVRDVASEPQQISTRVSRAQLQFSSGASGRMNRHSLMRLGSGCFLLEQGQVLVSGRQNGCTRSVRLSVRGTNYILELFDNGDAAVTSLQGTVEVETLRNGEPSGEAAITLRSGQRLRQMRAIGLNTVIDLTAADYRGIFEGPLFRGFRERLIDQTALEQHLADRVPGVTLPPPEPPRSGNAGSLNFGFGLGGGFGGGGGGHRGGGQRPTPPSHSPAAY